MMLPNNRDSFTSVPAVLSTRLNEAGVNPPVMVKGKESVLLGFAFLTIVIDAGNITASDERARSWLPPEPSRPIRRVWNGEPLIAEAEVPIGQNRWSAICPPQARTTVACVALKVIAI